MAWKGFVQESKSYMSYPNNKRGRFAEWNHISVCDGGWTMKERRAAKLTFWKAFPRAWFEFHCAGYFRQGYRYGEWR